MDCSDILIRLTFLVNGVDSYEVYRTHCAVQLFCQELLDLCDLSSLLSTVCSKVVTSADSIDLIQELNTLFRLVLDSPVIVQSEVFSLFLWDSEDSLDHSTQTNISSTSAVEFLLQSSVSQQLYIPRKAIHKLDFDLPEYATLVWRFCIQGGYDIEFSATFEITNQVGTQLSSTDVSHVVNHDDGSVQVVKAQRVCTPLSSTVLSFATSDCIQGSYSAIGPGKLSLIFDNSYSFVNGKYLEIATEIASKQTLEVLGLFN